MIPKSQWGEGPWQDEPDRDEWRDEATGLPCLAVRGPGGHWCGYVGVAPGHPLHGVSYSDQSPVLAEALERRKHQPLGDNPSFSVLVGCALGTGDFDATPETVFRVHGGLTYSARCNDHVYHVAQPGEPEDVWWFGFDCAHCDDVSPGNSYTRHDGSVYRTLAYVREQATSLAAQIAAVRGAE